MQKFIDKKAVWAEVVNALENALNPGQTFMLLKHSYLDSVEGDDATVVVDSDTIRGIFVRKVKPQVTQALSDIMKRPIRLRIGVSKMQIQEQFLNEGAAVVPGSSPVRLSDDETVLLERYGDIMGIVNNHPLFKRAISPIDRGGWGIFPQILTKKCKEFGITPVLHALRHTADLSSVRNRRAFFLHTLDKGQFGPRLAMSSQAG